VGTDELRIIGYYRLHPGLLDCPSYLRRNSFWTSLSRGKATTSATVTGRSICSR
jgi:hypothetical protein